ncbi:unnamed protein product [Dicrocoelium dendriticum]|nr:unnamed protein product [Dicrocoelium dendriticum]
MAPAHFVLVFTLTFLLSSVFKIPSMSHDCQKAACIIISGKRKCGKDYFVHLLAKKLTLNGLSNVVVHLSLPIKSHFAKTLDLSLDELLSGGPYKETYRKEMVSWAENQMLDDPHIFARQSLEMAMSSTPMLPSVVIVADARRPSDLSFFFGLWGRSRCLLLRICASESVRVKRGWGFTESIDNATTECGLDMVADWDHLVTNDDENYSHDELLDSIVKQISRILTEPES